MWRALQSSVYPLKDFQSNKLKPIYKSEIPPDLAMSPIPRWDLLKKGAYLNYSIQTTRGCPQDCDFCSVKAFSGKTYRHKPIENVVKEIQYLKEITGTKRIVLADDNITANKKYAKLLFQALKPLNIQWTSQASVDIANDDELLKLAAESGLTHIFIGIESVSAKSLQSVHKGINKVSEYKQIIQKLQSYNIQVFGSFILGLDGDDQATPTKILDFVNENKLICAMVSILTPYPGTKLYSRLQLDKRITNNDWAKYSGCEVCYQPKLYSIEALQSDYVKLCKHIYSIPNIVKRIENIQVGNILNAYQKLVISFKLLKILFYIKSLNPIHNILCFISLWKNRLNPDIFLLNLNFQYFARQIEKSR